MLAWTSLLWISQCKVEEELGSFTLMLSFEELQSLVAFATESGGPQLYRRLYGLTDARVFRLRSWDEWAALPPLTREYVSGTPLQSRLFCPLAEVDHLRVTSGTSGGPPLFCPRAYVHNTSWREELHGFSQAILSSTAPLMPHWHEQFQRGLRWHPRVIAFDPRRPAASIRLARAAGVDHLFLLTSHMPTVCELMQRGGMGDRVRLVEFAGESCSRALFLQVKKAFPHALVLNNYGCSEVEDWPIGTACRPLTEEELLVEYHAKSTQYLEVFNAETETYAPFTLGAEGELLISAFPKPPRTFPLIRYNIGDRVRVTAECGIHGAWSFVVLGRSEADFLKVPGGVLAADEVERVLRGLGDHVSDQFELHRYERATPGGVRVEAVLHVDARAHVNLAALTLEIASKLRINPVRTYADGVADGLYLPLRCIPLQKQTDPTQKRRRMVWHS